MTEIIRRTRTSWTPAPAPFGSLEDGNLLVRLDHPDARMPRLAMAGDAGLDLYTSERTAVPGGQFVDVPCGISLQLPVEHWGRITGRSSTLRKRGLLVNEAVIDNGYTGPIYVGVRNLGTADVVVEVGDRLAQLVLHRLVRVPICEIEGGLTSRDGRGGAGFGSTGN